MIRIITIAGTVLASLIAGCATQPSPERLALIQEIDRTIPTCSDNRECEVKWNAARTWIVKNAGWKLQHVTPDYLETYNSVDASVYLAVRVNKEPTPDGGYRILGSVWCANILGCHPDKYDALLDFNRSVNKSWTPPQK